MSDDINQPPEMTMNIKLTATQTTVIKTAAARPDGKIEPLPTNLRGGERTYRIA